MNREKYMGDPRYAKVLEKMDLLGIMDITTTRQDKNGTIVWRLPIKNNHRPTSFIEVASFKTGYVRNQNSGYSNYQLNKRVENQPTYYKDYEWVDGKQKWTGKYRQFTTRGCKLIPIEIERLEYLISYCLKNYYIKRANEVADGKLIPKWNHEYELEKAKDKYKKLDDFCESSRVFNESMLEGTVPKWKYDEAMDLGKTNAKESDYRIQDLERMLERYKTREKDLEEKIHQAHNKHNKAYNDGYAAAEVDYKGFNDVSVTVNGEKYKII